MEQPPVAAEVGRQFDVLLRSGSRRFFSGRGSDGDGFFLPLLGAIVAFAAFHEIGHASGCYYSGARPGRIGCGLYLAWPAFYTDVTDAYRLERKGRIKQAHSRYSVVPGRRPKRVHARLRRAMGASPESITTGQAILSAV